MRNLLPSLVLTPLCPPISSPHTPPLHLLTSLPSPPSSCSIVDGEVRKMEFARSYDDLVSYVEDELWMKTDPVPWWKSPLSLQSVLTHYTHVYTHVLVYRHTHTCMHVHTNIHTNSATVAAGSSHTSMHSCTDTCTHARTHTCTHARTHALTNNEYFGLVGLMHAPMSAYKHSVVHACAPTHNQLGSNQLCFCS